jgi:hypothetical protein
VTAEHLALVSAAVAAVSAVGSVASAIVSSRNGKRQQDSAREIARMNLIAPMREAWVTKLRERLAGYISGAGQINAGKPVPETLGFVRHEIGMMLDREQDVHVELETALDELLRAVIAKPQDAQRFSRAIEHARGLSNAVVQTEWQPGKGGQIAVAYLDLSSVASTLSGARPIHARRVWTERAAAVTTRSTPPRICSPPLLVRLPLGRWLDPIAGSLHRRRARLAASKARIPSRASSS